MNDAATESDDHSPKIGAKKGDGAQSAIANMTAITEKFGTAPRSFLIVPLVGAFFFDIANALVIGMALSWLY